MALYQLTLFYPNLKDHQRTVQEIRREVELVAGKSYRVLSPGAQVCAIGFETEIPREQLHDRFSGFGSEFFGFLLVEVADTVQGWLSKDVWNWMHTRIPDRR